MFFYYIIVVYEVSIFYPNVITLFLNWWYRNKGKYMTFFKVKDILVSELKS